MFCENCGNKIENGVCTNCIGNTENNLTIERKKSFVGCAINIHIDVNGEHYELGNGQKALVALPEGEHELKYKVWCRREKSVVIHVQKGKQYRVAFKYDALWGGFKLTKDSVVE